MKTIYTIGHSTHSLDYFLELLQTHTINCIIDVRSVAASAYNPQYNKVPLANFLKKNGIIYMHFAYEFGARQEAYLNQDGQVDFVVFQQSKAFQRGVQRLKKGLDKNFRIAMMCSESNPLDCHRFAMISIYLKQQGFDIQHILKDKTQVTQEDLEINLLKQFAKKLPKPTIFEPNISKKDQLIYAYKLKNKEIGYKKQLINNS